MGKEKNKNLQFLACILGACLNKDCVLIGSCIESVANKPPASPIHSEKDFKFRKMEETKARRLLQLKFYKLIGTKAFNQ
jgi:hypothetical protein